MTDETPPDEIMENIEDEITDAIDNRENPEPREITTPNGTLTVTTDPDKSTAYVTSITVSSERKRSDGEYGSDTDFVSETVQLSPAVGLNENGRNGEAVIETMDKARHLLECHLNGEEEE